MYISCTSLISCLILKTMLISSIHCVFHPEVVSVFFLRNKVERGWLLYVKRMGSFAGTHYVSTEIEKTIF